MTQSVWLYVGTYSRPMPGLKATNGQGIHIYRLNLETGALTAAGEMPHIDNPSFLAITRDQRYLYAVSEVWLWQEGMVTAYAINAATGALAYINKQATRGSITAYIALDRADQYALVANYWDGETVAVLPLRADGGVLPATDSVRHEGHGSNPERQEKPHGHCIITDPTNTWAYVVDLGIDQIVSYHFDRQYGRLRRHDALTLPAGTGPRQLTFHPNGKFAYVIGELNSTITALAFESGSGALSPLQTVSALPAGVSPETSFCSEIQVHPSGRFVYGANRGHDSIVVYAVDEATGHLTYVQHQPTLGSFPRHFAIDPTGTFLLVGNQNSDTIVTFRLDARTGALEPTGQIAAVPTPVCLKMITAAE